MAEAFAASTVQIWDDTEQFIEDQYPIDIRESLTIDCEVKQNGFREFYLHDMLSRHILLNANKSLRFWVKDISVAEPYEIFWKVLNRGEVARRKNCIRGQIVRDEGKLQKTETTNFRGNHVVECYCVKDGVVVAKIGLMFRLSLTMTKMTDDAKILEGQLRECYGRVVYSHKTHEKCADILMSRHGHIKMGQIILSALVTGGIVSTFFGIGNIGAAISVVLSTLLLILNAYTKDYDLGEIAQKHRQAGSDLWIIREKYLSLLTDIRIGGASLNAIRERRDKLMKELHAVYAGASSTNYKAYRKAQEALKKLEDMTFSDEEINAFLPQELKRKGKN